LSGCIVGARLLVIEGPPERLVDVIGVHKGDEEANHLANDIPRNLNITLVAAKELVEI
jgi:hypothetical protein